MSCQITFPTLHVWWFLGFSAPCQHVGPHTPTCTPSVHLSHRSPLFPFPPLPFPWCPRAILVIFCALPWWFSLASIVTIPFLISRFSVTDKRRIVCGCLWLNLYRGRTPAYRTRGNGDSDVFRVNGGMVVDTDIHCR